MRATSAEAPAGTPAKVSGGQSARVPSGGSALPPSGDKPNDTYTPSPEPSQAVPAPLLPPDAGLSYYKGVGLKDIGFDKQGKVIQHRRSEKIASQIAVWIAGGADANAICIRLNMRPGKLKELYQKEIATGLDMVGMDLTASIYQRAKKSDRLAIFFAKARLGWRDGEGAAREASLLNINIHL